jgi:hypothetical protein
VRLGLTGFDGARLFLGIADYLATADANRHWLGVVPDIRQFDTIQDAQQIVQESPCPPRVTDDPGTAVGYWVAGREMARRGNDPAPRPKPTFLMA